MNGNLSEHPLAELIREISLKGLSGTVRLHHKSVEAVVYFEEGRLVFAASNLRHLRLREYLRKQELVSEKNLAVLETLSDQALASGLRAKNILTPEMIETLFATQVADVLKVALLWTEGFWDFDDRRHLADPVRVQIDLKSLLVDVARRMRLEFVPSRFKNSSEVISPVAMLPEMTSLLPTEGFILSRVEGPISLNELLSVSGLGDLQAYRTIYGLALGGFLEREHWPTAFRSGPGKSAGKTKLVTPPKPVPVELLPVMDSLPASEEDLLDEFLRRLENATNHYEVLNVAATANVVEIKQAYYALARQYHPDRFHNLIETPLHARVEAAFARITNAYETLSTATSRTNYDNRLATLAKSRKFADLAPKAAASDVKAAKVKDRIEAQASRESELEQAEISFADGFAALEQGQINTATTLLAAAARLVPREARYRAHYGRALAAHEKTRRLAEAEIKSAIQLDPDNASYRVLLAELYVSLGFHKRAIAEAERALASEPNSVPARSLLRKLGMNRKAG